MKSDDRKSQGGNNPPVSPDKAYEQATHNYPGHSPAKYRGVPAGNDGYQKGPSPESEADQGRDHKKGDPSRGNP